MRLCYVIKGLGLGGAERHVVDCALHFSSMGFEVSVVYFLSNKRDYESTLISGGVEVYCVGNSAFELYRYLSHKRPDIVHSHLPVPTLICRVLKTLLNFKLVSTHHNLLARQRFVVKILERVSHKLDDSVISCSEEVSASIPWKTLVIPNGVAQKSSSQKVGRRIRTELGLSNKSIIFLCVANMQKKKNLPLLVKAFDLAFRSGLNSDNAHLVLIGQDASEGMNIRSLARSMSVCHRIHFWGADPTAAEIIPEADVFCMSSDFEGLPIALLEAMSAGLPSIVTNAGGMASVIDNGLSGYVVEKGDVIAFKNSLKDLLLDSELRAKMGRYAQKVAQSKYSQSAMLQRIHDVYKNSYRNISGNIKDPL